MRWIDLNREYWSEWNTQKLKELMSGPDYMPKAVFIIPFYWSMSCFVGLKNVSWATRWGLLLAGILGMAFVLLSGAMHNGEEAKMEFLCPMSSMERRKKKMEKYCLVVFYRLLAFLFMDIVSYMLLKTELIYWIPVVLHQIIASVIIVYRKDAKTTSWTATGSILALVLSAMSIMMCADDIYTWGIAIFFGILGVFFYIPTLISSAKAFREITYYEEA